MKIGSVQKIIYHREKLDAYLRGASILPATLELDLTSVCNRRCPNCASTTQVSPYQLPTNVVARVLASLEGETRGLILTGGEPTLAPNFADTLRLARQHRFQEVVIVSNGTCLDKERVTAALLQDASAIRVSLYDWSASSLAGLEPTLKRIETLRVRIEKSKSQLKIGVSALTTRENAGVLPAVAQRAQAAGAHWIYFHPLCAKWNSGEPARVDQTGVVERIEEIVSSGGRDFSGGYFRERYAHELLEFNGYHAAHFLLVIGADGMNYLAPEVKYQRRHIIADVRTNPAFLRQRDRIEHIRTVRSQNYPAIASRHRGMLYNDLIERLMRAGDTASASVSDDFLFPHIL